MGTKAWEGVFDMPQPGRSMKPRSIGFTMVLDKGLGLNATQDLMDTAADYIDSLKLTFGTSAFYDESVLRKKVEIVTGAGVDIYPGGTFLEVTVWQGRYAEYLKRARELGFTAIEVSDSTVEMADEVRADWLKRAPVIHPLSRKRARLQRALPRSSVAYDRLQASALWRP